LSSSRRLHAGGVKVALQYHLTSNVRARSFAGSSAEVKGYYCQILKLFSWRFAVRIREICSV